MKPGRPAAIFTALALSLAVPLFLFAQLLAFNGVSERKATSAIALWFVGHVVLLCLATFSAGRGAQALALRLQWNRLLSNFLTAFFATGFGVLGSFVMVLISCLVMGIR